MAKQPKLNEKESEERKRLLDYIQMLYLNQGYSKEQIPWQMLVSQIKNILDENKTWNHAQLRYCLNYMVEIEELNLFNEQSNGSILSLVPFYYTQAREFALKSQHIKQLVKDFDFEDNVITIKKGNIDRCKKWKEIPLDSL